MAAELGTDVSAADRERLAALVRDKVFGVLRDSKLIESYDTERIYIVLWVDPTKFGRDERAGTHRAHLSTVDDRAVLVYGDYFDGIGSYQQAVEDFRARANPYDRLTSFADRSRSPLERLGLWLASAALLLEEPTHEEVDRLLRALSNSEANEAIGDAAYEAGMGIQDNEVKR